MATSGKNEDTRGRTGTGSALALSSLDDGARGKAAMGEGGDDHEGERENQGEGAGAGEDGEEGGVTGAADPDQAFRSPLGARSSSMDNRRPRGRPRRTMGKHNRRGGTWIQQPVQGHEDGCEAEGRAGGTRAGRCRRGWCA
jgi:hypothetical protein